MDNGINVWERKNKMYLYTILGWWHQIWQMVRKHITFFFRVSSFFWQLYPCTIVFVSFTICCFRLALTSCKAVDRVQCPIGWADQRFDHQMKDQSIGLRGAPLYQSCVFLTLSNQCWKNVLFYKGCFLPYLPNEGEVAGSKAVWTMLKNLSKLHSRASLNQFLDELERNQK